MTLDKVSSSQKKKPILQGCWERDQLNRKIEATTKEHGSQNDHAIVNGDPIFFPQQGSRNYQKREREMTGMCNSHSRIHLGSNCWVADVSQSWSFLPYVQPYNKYRSAGSIKIQQNNLNLFCLQFILIIPFLFFLSSYHVFIKSVKNYFYYYLKKIYFYEIQK